MPASSDLMTANVMTVNEKAALCACVSMLGVTSSRSIKREKRKRSNLEGIYVSERMKE